jgi:peroxiredoxin
MEPMMTLLIRNIITACLFSLLPAIFCQAEELPPVPDLGERISDFQVQRPTPAAQQRAIMDKAAQDLAVAMPEPGLRVGDHAPDFTLPDAYGNDVRLSDLLAQGPVILTFYRGAWCPYCNLQLHALKESMPHFQRHSARLVAITPQTPDFSRGQIEKDAYPFHILSDLDYSVMQAYKLYFEVSEALRTLYIQDFGLDITDYNGKERYGLPIPGTFVIDQRGFVRAAFADTDYKRRMEPAAIIEALADIEARQNMEPVQ